MSDSNYSKEFHDLLMHVTQLNAGIINQKKLKAEIEKLKLDNGNLKIINQPWIKALDYLDDYKTKIAILQDLCDFEHKIKIVIEWKPTKEPNKVLTSILEVESTDTVETVKDKIRRKISYGASPDQQRLYLKEKLLQDDRKTMTDYNIQNGSVLRLEPSFFRLFCQTLDGVITTIVVCSSDSIKIVKGKLEIPSGYSVDEQILVYNGQQLRDCLTLADYDITSETTIEFTINQVGS